MTTWDRAIERAAGCDDTERDCGHWTSPTMRHEPCPTCELDQLCEEATR